MIRTFLDQLLWELRIRVFECELKPGAANPAAGGTPAKLRPYMERWNNAGLLPVVSIKTDDPDSEDIAAVYKKVAAIEAQRGIDAIEALKPFLPVVLHALESYSTSGEVPHLILTAKELMKRKGILTEPHDFTDDFKHD